MSQNSIVIANGTGAAVRTALNNALDSLSCDFSGVSEPGTTWALMKWADTTNNILKIRNLGNTAWISFMDLTTGNLLTNAATATTAEACTGNAATATFADSASAMTRFQLDGFIGASLTIAASTETTIQKIYISMDDTEHVIKLKRARYWLGGGTAAVLRIGGDSYWQSSSNIGDENLNTAITVSGALDEIIYISIYNNSASSITLSREAGWWADLSME